MKENMQSNIEEPSFFEEKSYSIVDFSPKKSQKDSSNPEKEFLL
jgi:hypothetical protein